MGLKTKFSVHPLFIIFGIYFVAIGKVFSFLVFSLSALLHEFGHYCKAQKLGYMLVKVQLMPYGAVIVGDISGIRFKDEISVAIIGPIVNLFIGFLCVALWWIFPDLYSFTQEIAIANFSLFFINLIPAFPLDGGRVLLAGLSCIIKRKKAVVICKTVSCLCVLGLIALFIVSAIKGQTNVSILFFAFFILFGAFSNAKDNKYVKYYSRFKQENIVKCSEVKTIAVGKKTTVKQLLNRIDGEYLYEVKVLNEKGETIKSFSPQRVLKILSEASLYDEIAKLNI